MKPTYEHLSASCQQVIHNDLSDASNPSILIRSCLSDPDLLPAIVNHKCNNVVLTPSGLYFDMAITVARYIVKNNHSVKGGNSNGINVYDMQVHKPLVIQDVSRISESWIEMEATAILSTSNSADNDEHEPNNTTLKCTFSSITHSGERLQTMGHCSVSFEDSTSWLSTWSHHAPMIQSRIDKLLTRAHKETTGKVRLVQSEQAYEMFESFVQYSGPYRNMKEVVFDYETLEATSLLDFQGLEGMNEKGPFLWDGSCHVSGFVCNAVEKDGRKNAFISYGVGSMRISEEFRPLGEGKGKCRNYVRMETVVGDSNVLQGSVYVLQDGRIVGLWEDVRFKKIPRRVLNVLLPPGKG